MWGCGVGQEANRILKYKVKMYHLVYPNRIFNKQNDITMSLQL